jgi:hypothetical protein
MKAWLMLLLALGLFFSATAQADDKAEIQLLLAQFLDGASRNDAKVHNSYWADELIYTSSRGSRFGKTELMQGVNSKGLLKAEDVETVYSSDDVRIMQYGDIAVLAFVLAATSDTAVQRYLNSGTLVKRNGRWQAVSWQATAMATEE